MNTKKAVLYLHNTINNEIGLNQCNKPKVLSYLITNLCNSHCITCSVWRNKEPEEITEAEFKLFLSDSLLDKVQHVGISGGEPSTFSSLLKHIEIMIDSLPSLATVSITSNCIHADFWLNNLPKIMKLLAKYNLYFQLNISLDGIGKVHDRIRGTSDNFVQVNKVVCFALERRIPIQFHSTINRYNVYHVNAILYYAKSLNVDIIFRLASEIYRLDNKRQIERIVLNDKEKSFLCDFLSSTSLLNYTKSPGRKLFYKSLVKQLLSDGIRLSPCYFKKEGLVLSSDGSLSFCSRFQTDFDSIYSGKSHVDLYRNATIRSACSGDTCVHCYHDQTGLWALNSVLGLCCEKKLILLKKVATICRYLINSQFRFHRKSNKKEIKSIAIVGMYGGEHVGDAAILGGVIRRTLDRYPCVEQINIYSFRKDRTLCWVNCLTELPENISITIYGRDDDFRKILHDCELLVWAGGPLMELPLVMSRNYAFVREALSLGCRFEMEGIGYGPINTILGKVMAKKILKEASRITVRSKSDKSYLINKTDCIDEGISEIDPAFDYLSLLPENLQLMEQEKKEIDQIFQENRTGKTIALNLRPLWRRYGSQQGKRKSLDNFMDEIVGFVNTVSERGFLTIFFPMNADQYGFSDLNVAYEIRERIKSGTLFYIWETEPSINMVIYMLRKVDFSICMRFHAVVFSKSQNVKTIGIDYSLNGRGKVSTLFEEKKDCFSIVDFKANLLMKRIEEYECR